jgi:hypothetical protein
MSPGYSTQMQDGRFPALLEPFEPRSSTHAIVQRAAKLLQNAFTPADLGALFATKLSSDALKASSKLDAQSNAVADLVIGMSPVAATPDALLDTLNLLVDIPSSTDLTATARRASLYKVVEAMGELYHVTSEKIVGRSMNLAFPGQPLKLTV